MIRIEIVEYEDKFVVREWPDKDHPYDEEDEEYFYKSDYSPRYPKDIYGDIIQYLQYSSLLS